MPHYCGITTDLARRREEHEAQKKNVHNWTPANGGVPFLSRSGAQEWENKQPGVHDPRGAPATGPWYGYCFDYDA